MFKKNLLNTTALAAIIGTAGVISVSNPAHSQEISVGAYVKTLIGFWSDDREDQNDIEMRNDAEVHVKGSNTSDAGLEYGITIELAPDLAGSGIALQEADMYMRGEFGTIRIGDNDGAGDSLSVFAPTGFGTGGIDGNFGDWSSVGTALKPVDTGDNTKITYFSPKVNNIQAGLSFTPQPNKGKTVITDEATSGYENGIEFGVNFVGDVGDGINLQAGVTGSFQSAVAEGADDNLSFLIGAKVTVQDFTVGGGFVTFGDGRNEDIGFNAGVQYTQGAFAVGLNMSLVQAENIVRTSTLTLLTTDIDSSTNELTADAVTKINAALDADPSVATAINMADDITGTVPTTNMVAADSITAIASNQSIGYGEPQDTDYLVIAAGATYHIAPGLKGTFDAVYYDDEGDGERGIGSGFVVLGGFQISF